MTKVVISACIITYNQEKFIRECIEGAINQHVNYSYEIVIADDFSTDSTKKICLEYAQRYPHLIRVLPSSKNLGMIGNWIKAIGACQGKYIALCEGDDYWTDPLKLQKQVDFLETNPEYVISGHDAIIIDEKGNIISNSKLPDSCKRDATEEELQKGFWILTLSMCFRNVLKSFPKQLSKVTNADTFLTSILGMYGKAKYHADIQPAVYRIHSAGIWSNQTPLKARATSANTIYQLAKYHKFIKNYDIHFYYRDYALKEYLFLINHFFFTEDIFNYINAHCRVIYLLYISRRWQDMLHHIIIFIYRSTRLLLKLIVSKIKVSVPFIMFLLLIL